MSWEHLVDETILWRRYWTCGLHLPWTVHAIRRMYVRDRDSCYPIGLTCLPQRNIIYDF